MKNPSSRRYFIAVTTAGCALAIRLALSPFLGEKAPLVLSVLAVITASRYGGKVAGLLTMVLCGVGSALLLPLPRIGQADELISLLLFAVVGVGISIIGGQLHDALRKTAESEERYRGISEALPQLIWTCGPEGYCNHLNTRWVEYTGIPAEKQFGFAWQAQVHPEDLPVIRDAWKEPALTGANVQVEFRIRRYDGAWRWFDGRAVALRGTVPGFIFSFHLAGRRSGSVPYASAYVKDLCGLSPEDIHDDVTPLFQRIHPEDLDRVWSSIHDCARQSVPWRAEFRLRHPEKGEVWIEGLARPGESTDLKMWYGVMMDITARKRMEAEQQRTEALYRAISANLPNTAVYVVDSEFRYLAVAGPLAEATGFSRKRLEGRLLSEVLTGDYYTHAVESFRRAFEGDAHVSEAVHGEWTISTHHVPLRDRNGEVTAAMAICQDITSDRRAQEEIRKLNEELELRVYDRTMRLEAANQELEAFAYSVSHDLRAPLRGIDGWSEALAEDFGGAMGEKAQQSVARIRSEAQRMAVLIDGLLDLSRLSRAEMRWLPVDISALANRHASLLREANPARRILFHVQPDMAAQGDPRLLEAAIGNLMENAVKFTRPREEASIEVGGVNGNVTEFFVRDNGVGFDMSHSAHLFGAFQRLHKASEFPGTGIGLATVQRVIHRHGGRIWADAREDEGATFHFTLASPRMEQKQPEEKSK